ncbi:MAG: class I SAM-dependent methyltransferase [Hyphomicrobiales bacterium]
MDIVDLKEFYGTRIGAATRRMIAHRIGGPLNAVAGTVVGLGFAMPYLEHMHDGVRPTFALMMARSGVCPWPEERPNSAALVDEYALPFLESTVDFVFVIHGLELADDPGEMLCEIWRVLRPQGRLLLVVPNRRGMWARFDTTPFGYGQPYSRPQLHALLREARFAPSRWSQALFMPPFERSLVITSAPAWERIGLWVSPAFSGVIIVEAMKQVYALSSGRRARRAVPKLKPALATPFQAKPGNPL